MKVAVAIICMLLMPASSFSQSQKPAAPVDDREASAHDAVMRFLQGVKIAELPEGKTLLADTQWIVGDADYGKHFYSRPDHKDATSIFAGLFETDVPGVKGYKELFDMTAITKAATTKELKFLVIAFKDLTTQQWKIMGSVDNSDDESAIDVASQIDFFKAHLDDTKYSSARDNYASYGHWLLLGGRLLEARAALTSASSASMERTAIGYPDRNGALLDLQIRAMVQSIDKIAPSSGR